MELDKYKLKNILQNALKSSVQKGKEEWSNQLKSSLFCSEVGEKMDNLIKDILSKDTPFNRRQIKVLDSGERQSGEWMLDIVWTQDCFPDQRMYKDALGIPERTLCAVECESSTISREFFTDLSKLIYFRSPIKLFLGGINQKNEISAIKYMTIRLNQAYDLIVKSGEKAETTLWGNPPLKK